MIRTGAESTITKNVVPLTADRLRGLPPIRSLPGRNANKANLEVYSVDGIDVALKDYRSRSFIVRHTIGRFSTRREVKGYLAAASCEGVPEFLGRLGPVALAVRWIDGKTLRSLAGQPMEGAIFDRLEAILDRLHARGVAMGDLHHSDVLISDDGSVHVLDFATAIVLGRRAGPIRRSLFERACEQDRIACARLRARFMGDDEARAVQAVGERAAARYRRARRLKALWDRLRGRNRG